MKYLRIIVEIVLIILLVLSLIPKKDNLIEKVNELELKLDSLNNLKDSIRTVIDSTHVKIITNEKHYQERINTIITQPATEDSSFVSDYIRRWSDKNSQFNFN